MWPLAAEDFGHEKRFNPNFNYFLIGLRDGVRNSEEKSGKGEKNIPSEDSIPTELNVLYEFFNCMWLKGEKLMKAAKDCDSIAVLDHLKNGSDINYKDMVQIAREFETISLIWWVNGYSDFEELE